jgi:hypothetical protein
VERTEHPVAMELELAEVGGREALERLTVSPPREAQELGFRALADKRDATGHVGRVADR